MPVRSRRYVRHGWTPRSIPGLIAGWDFGALGLANDAAIASVPDLVGSNPAIQGTAGNKPTYKLNGINGRPAAFFTTDDFLTADGVATLLAGTNVPFSMLSVFAPVDNAATQGVIFAGANANNPSMYLLRVTGGPFGMVSNRTNDAGTTKSLTGTGSGIVTSGKGDAYALTFNGATAEGWFSSAMRQVGTTSDWSGGACTFTRFTFGAQRRATNAQFIVGHLGEVWLCSGPLDKGTVTQFMRYAAMKWNTP